ncbi:MAG: hypothetical protein AVDCRST_MAG11-1688, partial [uncultured Gemmatimonadaceae bacterium]
APAASIHARGARERRDALPPRNAPPARRPRRVPPLLHTAERRAAVARRPARRGRHAPCRGRHPRDPRRGMGTGAPRHCAYRPPRPVAPGVL